MVVVTGGAGALVGVSNNVEVVVGAATVVVVPNVDGVGEVVVVVEGCSHVVETITGTVVVCSTVVVGSTVEVVVGSTVVVVDCSVVVVSTVVVVVVPVVCGTTATLVDTSYDTPSYQRFGSPQQTPALSLYEPGSSSRSMKD